MSRGGRRDWLKEETEDGNSEEWKDSYNKKNSRVQDKKQMSCFGEYESKIKEIDQEKGNKTSVRCTEAKALSQDASRRHVFLSFYLGEVERAGEDENVHEVDEALQEGD